MKSVSLNIMCTQPEYYGIWLSKCDIYTHTPTHIFFQEFGEPQFEEFSSLLKQLQNIQGWEGKEGGREREGEEREGARERERERERKREEGEREGRREREGEKRLVCASVHYIIHACIIL